MSQPTSKLPKLTIKQAKFVKAKAEGKTGVQAAKEAYGITDYNIAASLASENIRKPNIQEAVQAEMVRQGITLEAIIKPVKEALTAEKVSIVGNGDQAMAEVTPDHGVRLKAVSIASQFMGVGRGEVAGSITNNFIAIADNQKSKYSL